MIFVYLPVDLSGACTHTYLCNNIYIYVYVNTYAYIIYNLS